MVIWQGEIAGCADSRRIRRIWFYGQIDQMIVEFCKKAPAGAAVRADDGGADAQEEGAVARDGGTVGLRWQQWPHEQAVRTEKPAAVAGARHRNWSRDAPVTCSVCTVTAYYGSATRRFCATGAAKLQRRSLFGRKLREYGACGPGTVRRRCFASAASGRRLSLRGCSAF